MQDIIQILATELNVQSLQVQAAVELLDGGATVPFIARYRKEATGGLDDIVLRELDVRLVYLRELQERRAVVSQAIAQQGKLTPLLQASIESCSTKQQLEDLYLPFKLKRRTKGQMAIEAGLEPLANGLFANPALVPEQAALAYLIEAKPEEPGLDKAPDFSNVPAVLDGVRDILSERWAQEPALVHDLREWMWSQGLLCSTLLEGKHEAAPEVAKFRDYFDYSEAVARIPSHRALAVFRGRALDVLDIRLELPDNSASPSATDQKALPAAAMQATARMASLLGWRHQNRAGDDLIRKCLLWTWRVKLSLSTERDVLSRLREAAEKVAIKVFADNLRDRLLAAPAGPRVVLGLDPGIRTGVKVAVVDATGKLVETATVFPHEPRRDWDGALLTLAALSKRHGVNLIAIGNGTASRETDKLASDLIKQLSQSSHGIHPTIDKVVVSEAGASVYSASEYASKEMPDVDVSLRGAASIARRLQDPLAELVKIDPKAIGVGQYQHDVNQNELARTLDAVVEDCVNAVGVDINTASTALLGRVSGVSPTVAQALVGWREAHGVFACRQDLLQVAGLGRKTFEQCAGFLRIRGGSNPLDMTGVHPETYPVVEKIMATTGKPVAELMGRAELLKTLKPELFANDTFGVITVKDILQELEKPGRDPRGSFKVAKLSDSVMDLADLKVGMVLEGTVSNVAAFGAFVDLGVHQDGLVHVSQLAHKFVADAREAVKTGDVVKVQVLEVDLARKRIALSMKLGAVPGDQASRNDSRPDPRANPRKFEPRAAGTAYSTKPTPVNAPSAMASAFAKLGR